MTDRISKVLDRLTDKEREAIQEILQKIARGDFEGCDVKKLQGLPDVYRVRKGTWRIIFRMSHPDDVRILAVERRSDTTYRALP